LKKTKGRNNHNFKQEPFDDLMTQTKELALAKDIP
jgi:hypothetical protein